MLCHISLRSFILALCPVGKVTLSISVIFVTSKQDRLHPMQSDATNRASLASHC